MRATENRPCPVCGWGVGDCELIVELFDLAAYVVRVRCDHPPAGELPGWSWQPCCGPGSLLCIPAEPIRVRVRYWHCDDTPVGGSVLDLATGKPVGPGGGEVCARMNELHDAVEGLLDSLDNDEADDLVSQDSRDSLGRLRALVGRSR